MPCRVAVAVAVAIALVACSGSAPGQRGEAGTVGGDDAGASPDDGPAGLEPGSLQVSWMHGSPHCAQNTEPEWQVHAYNTTLHVIRQNMCRTFEAPFVYLIQGTSAALLIDTGATTTTALRDIVRDLIGTKQLIVAHSHGHGDHVASDSQFTGQPNTTVVGKSVAAIQSQFSIASWPTSPGSLDLGGRVLDVLGIPGHEPTHIAIYDRRTGLLFTGDSLYPGLLFVNDWAAYRTSIGRLAQFAAAHPIAHVLGAHIEMTSTPKQVYPYGTTYQPAEHVLPLSAAHIVELDMALTQLGATPPGSPVAYDDFVIDPP